MIPTFPLTEITRQSSSTLTTQKLEELHQHKISRKLGSITTANADFIPRSRRGQDSERPS